MNTGILLFHVTVILLVFIPYAVNGITCWNCNSQFGCQDYYGNPLNCGVYKKFVDSGEPAHPNFNPATDKDLNYCMKFVPQDPEARVERYCGFSMAYKYGMKLDPNFGCKNYTEEDLKIMNSGETRFSKEYPMKPGQYCSCSSADICNEGIQHKEVTRPGDEKANEIPVSTPMPAETMPLTEPTPTTKPTANPNEPPKDPSADTQSKASPDDYDKMNGTGYVGSELYDDFLEARADDEVIVIKGFATIMIVSRFILLSLVVVCFLF